MTYAAAMRAKEKLLAQLVGDERLVAAGISREAGKFVILLYGGFDDRSGLPAEVDGFPVRTRQTGPAEALGALRR